MSPFVSLFTSGPAGAAPAAPRSTSSPAVVASRPGQRKKSDWAPVGLLALLFFCLFVLFVVDLCSSAQDNEEHVGVKTKSGLRTLPVYQIKPIDLEPRINVLFTRESQRFGITCAKLMDPLNPRKPKKLTRDERGLTNNTCIWIEGYQFLLGHELPGARYMKEKGILQREVKIDDHTWQSIFRIEQSRTVITQTVRLVVGEHTRLYDTALIHYQVWNQDTKQHQIGLRTMIDTYIGANDGVPFLIPPREDATATRDKNGYLEAKKRVFPQKEIPDFVRAVENTTASATVAEMGLRLADVEPLHQFVICRWPDNAEARWDWDYLPMDYGFEKGREKDSCAVLYWDKKIMNPGEKREMAFTYGLGRMAKYRGVPGDEGGTDLRLLTAGSTQITDTFTATAMVRGGGGKVTLELPAGFSIVRGDQTQSVGTCKKDEYAQVSWRIKSKELGPFTIKAKHDVIGTAEVDLNINTKSIFGR